jgi:hypothetical protein
LGTAGRWFESSCPDQFFNALVRFLRRGAVKPILRRVQLFLAAGDIGLKRSALSLDVIDQHRSWIMTKSICKAALIAAFAVSFSTLSTPSHAFTAEAQQMCTEDAFRLCSSEIPDIPRITACMIKNRASLSSGCRAVMDHDQAAQPATTRKPPLG